MDELLDRLSELMGERLYGKISHENGQARCERLAKLMVQTKDGCGFSADDKDEVTRILIDPTWRPFLA